MQVLTDPQAEQRAFFTTMRSLNRLERGDATDCGRCAFELLDDMNLLVVNTDCETLRAKGHEMLARWMPEVATG